MVMARTPTTHSDRPRLIVLKMTITVFPVVFAVYGQRDGSICAQFSDANCIVADHVPFVVWQPQKKGASPIIVKQRNKLINVKGVSCIDRLSVQCHHCLYCQNTVKVCL